MYREFYDFSENPFNLTPDPSFLFKHIGYDDVCSSIEFGIKERKGVMVITGEVGTGKTTLIHTLLKELSEKIRTAFIFNPNLTFKELLETILHYLKIPAAEENTFSLLGRLNEFLKERMAEGDHVLIIIDEAQNLSRRVLDDLDRLCQQVPSDVNVPQILLVGQLELENKLNSKESGRLKQRVTIQKQIGLLDFQESRQYIDHRLRVVGSSSSKVFTPEAVKVICEYAKGIPRVINLICDRALLAGYEASAPVIDDRMVRKAIAENEITIEEKPFGQEKVIAGMEPHFKSGKIFQGRMIQEILGRDGLPVEKMESVGLAADYSLGAGAEIDAQVDKKRAGATQKRGRSERGVSPRQKTFLGIGGVLVVILFGLTLTLFRSELPRQSATQETMIEQPSQARGGTEPVKEHSVAVVAPSAAKTQLQPRETGTGSDPSLQKDEPGKEQETRVSKKTSARSEKVGAQKPIERAALSVPSEQAMTSSLPQRTGPMETGRALHERGEFSSGDRKASASENSRTDEESQKKEKEEIDPGKAIDWLLKKRSEKASQE